MTLDAGLLRLDYTGVLTRDVWLQAARAAAQWAGGKGLVLLVDVSRALVAVSEAQLCECRPVRTALTDLGMPGAIVVPGVYLDAFRALAWGRAQEGIERAIFTSGPDALAWARLKLRRLRAPQPAVRVRHLAAERR